MRCRFYQTTPLYADVYGYRFCPTAEQFAWLADRWYALVKHPAQANMVASVAEDVTASECSTPDTKKQIKKDGKKGNGGAATQTPSPQPPAASSNSFMTEEFISAVNAL